MRLKYLIMLLIITAFYINNSNAQSAGLNFTMGFPMGEFKDNVSRTGFGLSGQFLFWNPSPQMPYSLGLNLGFINYGSESRTEPFNQNIPDVLIDVDRSNNLVNFHLLFQIAMPTGFFRPYIEGLFGGSYLYTETTVKNRRDTDEIAGNTNFDDFAWNYGGGGGFMIEVYSGEEAEEVSTVFIDLKVRYLFGSRAEYLKEGSVRIENGTVLYDISKSKTDLLTAQIGAVVFFNSIY